MYAANKKRKAKSTNRLDLDDSQLSTNLPQIKKEDIK
jgi:hypothetical protein